MGRKNPAIVRTCFYGWSRHSRNPNAAFGAPMNEHRAAPRHRILKAGTISFGGGTIDCTVRNLSETGAALGVVTPLFISGSFHADRSERAIEAAVSHRLAQGKPDGRGVRLTAPGCKQVSSPTAAPRQNQGQSETHRPSPRGELKRDHRAISVAVTITSERADACAALVFFAQSV